MSKLKEISIIGATGNLGIPVVHNLVKSGFRVNAIVRNPEKARSYFGQLTEVKISVADLRNTDDLRKALSGTEYLYLSLSTETADLNTPFASEREGVANILKSVDRETIRQIIAISGLGAFHNVKGQPGFEFIPNTIRKQGHKLIKDSGIPYTFLHCSWFADSFLIFSRNKVYTVLGNPETPVYFTNSYDFSMHLMNSIGNFDAYYKEFPIQGRTAWKHPEAARLVLSQLVEGSKVSLLPEGIISLMALFNSKMKFLKHMHSYFKASAEEFYAEEYDSYRILGEPILSLEDYARKIKKEDGLYLPGLKSGK